MSTSVFQTLNDISHSIDTRVAIAWEALNNTDLPPTSEDRVAAKCWLTHRVTDGTVPLDRWPAIHRVKPVYQNGDGLEVRWRISQAIAEMYLHGLKRKDVLGMQYAALAVYMERDNLNQWPPVILNYLRAMCVMALAQEDKEACAALVDEALCAWQQVMGGLNWKKFPMRLVELRDDLSALWQLVAIGRRCGAVQYDRFDWLPKFCGGTDPFSQLMRQLNAPQL